MCVALAALDATVHLDGAGGERTRAASPSCTGCPAISPSIETVLRTRRADHRGRAAAAAARAPLDLSQGARPGELRLRAGLRRRRAGGRRTATRQRDVRLALGGVAHKPWRALARRRRRCAAARPPRRRSAPPPRRSWPTPAPLRDNAFKIELAKRTISGPRRLAGAQHERARRTRHDAVSPMPGPLPERCRHRRDDQHGHVGEPVSRSTARLKVRGEARFAAEVPLEGMVYAALAFSTIARGRIAALDTAAAEAAPGVVLVMTHRNAPRMKPTARCSLTAPKAAGGDRPAGHAGRPRPLERPAGRGGAGRDAGAGRPRRVADPRHLRGRGGRHRRSTTAKATAHRARRVLGELAGSTSATPRRRWPRRRSQVDATYRTPRHNHNAIELHAATAGLGRRRAASCTTRRRRSPGPAGRWPRCSASTRSRCTSLSPFVGGGFGGKTLWQHQILAAAARGSPAGRCASCCRARASTGWSAGAPSPSSASRSARGADGRLDGDDPHRRRPR